MEDGDEIDAMLHQTGGGLQFLQETVDLHQNAWENGNNGPDLVPVLRFLF